MNDQIIFNKFLFKEIFVNHLTFTSYLAMRSVCYSTKQLCDMYMIHKLSIHFDFPLPGDAIEYDYYYLSIWRDDSNSEWESFSGTPRMKTYLKNTCFEFIHE